MACAGGVLAGCALSEPLPCKGPMQKDAEGCMRLFVAFCGLLAARFCRCVAKLLTSFLNFEGLTAHSQVFLPSSGYKLP